MALTDRRRALCDNPPARYAELKALFINCTLRRGPATFHAEGPMRVSMEIMEANGVGGVPAHGNQRSLWDAG